MVMGIKIKKNRNALNKYSMRNFVGELKIKLNDIPIGLNTPWTPDEIFAVVNSESSKINTNGIILMKLALIGDISGGIKDKTAESNDIIRLAKIIEKITLIPILEIGVGDKILYVNNNK